MLSKSRSSVLPLILFIIMGTAFASGIGVSFVDMKKQGAFISWRLLDANTLMFQEIVNPDYRIIWARATDAKTYWRVLDCDIHPQCTQWVETSDISGECDDFFGDYPMRKGDSCQFENNQYAHPKAQPPEVVECALAASGGPDLGIVTYYALLFDGTIWYWTLRTSRETLVLIGFALSGLIFGFVVHHFLVAGRQKNPSQQE